MPTYLKKGGGGELCVYNNPSIYNSFANLFFFKLDFTY